MRISRSHKSFVTGFITILVAMLLILWAAPVCATVLSADKKTEYTDGKLLVLPVDDGDTIYAGALVSVNADGYVIAGADTASTIFVGIAREYVDNSSGSDGDETVTVQRAGVFKMLFGTAISEANVGDNVFIADDATVDLTANVTHNIYVGIIAKYIDSTHAWVDITPAIQQADVATHIADASGAHAASAVSIEDVGTHTAQTEVESALQEIYQHLLSTQAFINLPIGAWTEADGTALADFADGDSTTPGWSAGDEGFGIRWNNHAQPDPISTSVPIPPDLDETADVIVHVLAAKTGATEADAVKWTIEAFNNVDAALYDADADFGGDSSAMTGTATAKTCQEETLTLAAANVAGSPCVLTLTLQPKDGTLGTDDVIVFGVWLEYTRKLLGS
ncbi:MAG: hypothetical protein JW884_14225 [Deltaproteobacteria bacterium]|nr:hypothetical protein [Deltaproteobacteria bacterium]